MGDQQIRVEELLVFRPDRTGLAETGSAIDGLNKKMKGLLESSVGMAKEEKKHVSDLVSSLRDITNLNDNDINAMVRKVGQLSMQNAGEEKLLKLLEEKYGITGSIAQATLGEIESSKKLINQYKEQREAVERILEIKKNETELTDLNEDQIKGVVSNLGAASYFQLKGLQMQAKTGESYVFQGLQLRKNLTVMETMNKSVGQLLVKYAKSLTWQKALAAAAITSVMHLKMAAGYTEIVKQHVQDTALASVVTGGAMGRLQMAFGITEEKAGEFVKNLAEAGLEAGEIEKYAGVIYARELMWNISATEQVDLMREIQYTMGKTGDEANQVMNLAGMTGKSLKAWTIKEVVDQFGEMTNDIRGANIDTLGMFGLIKAIAATDIGRGFGVFSNLSKQTQKDLMGSVGKIGEMDEGVIAIIAKMRTEWPKGVETTSQKLVQVRNELLGIADKEAGALNATQARTEALRATYKFLGEQTKGLTGRDRQLKVRYLMETTFLKGTSIEAKAEISKDLVESLDKGREFSTKSMTDGTKALQESVKSMDEKIYDKAVLTSAYLGGVLSVLNRMGGVVTTILSTILGDPAANYQKQLLDEYSKGATYFKDLGIIRNEKTGETEVPTQKKLETMEGLGLVTPDTTKSGFGAFSREEVLAKRKKAEGLDRGLDPGQEFGGEPTKQIDISPVIPDPFLALAPKAQAAENKKQATQDAAKLVAEITNSGGGAGFVDFSTFVNVKTVGKVNKKKILESTHQAAVQGEQTARRVVAPTALPKPSSPVRS